MRRYFCLLWVGLIIPAAAAAAENVTFHKSPAQPGDISRQTIDCDLDLEMSIQQGGQIVQSQRQGVLRQQVRELKVLAANARAATRAEVRYDRSSVALRTADATAQTSSQAVTGKTYLIARQADKLSVTYPDGRTPPADELELVTSNMETFGLPNPIAVYFDGKQMTVGQTIQLPAKLARELLGFSETVGNISEFQLQLVETRRLDSGDRAAVFAIALTADQPDETSVSMRLKGQLVMEIDTCRTAAVHLEGPISASETHGPDAGQFQVRSEGQIRVAVEASYTPLQR